MNKYLKVYLNWRINVLTIFSLVVIILLTSESEDLLLLFITKVLGIALAYVTFRLGKHWNNKGKIDELMELANEE